MSGPLERASRDRQIATLTAERDQLRAEVDDLRGKLRVVEEQNDALGDANVIGVERDQLRAALTEACDLLEEACVGKLGDERHVLVKVAELRLLAEAGRA